MRCGRLAHGTGKFFKEESLIKDLILCNGRQQPDRHRRLVLFNRLYHYRIPWQLIPVYDFLCRCVLCVWPSRGKGHHDRLVSLLYKVRHSLPLTHTVYTVTAASQKAYFTSHSARTETLILGTSHALFGYKAAGEECNLGVPSCDLYSMERLFERVLPAAPGLKRLVLFFSPFSSGFTIQRSSVALFVSPLLNVLWNIGYNPRGRVTAESLSNQEQMASFIRNKEKSLVLTLEEIWGLFRALVFPASCQDILRSRESRDRCRRSKATVVRSSLENSELPFFYGILRRAAAHGIKVYLVLPPFHEVYRELFSAHCFFRHLSLAVRNFENVAVLDYFSDASFGENDFADPDHLNAQGAQKLTLKIRTAIRALEDTHKAWVTP